MKKVGIIGAGSWGTALAIVINRAACDVVLWDRSEEKVREISSSNRNSKYLPGAFVDPAIKLTTNVAEVCDVDMLIITIPAQFVRAMVIQFANHTKPNVPVIIASKGIESGSLMLVSDVIRTVMPDNPIAILSGPNFAVEIAAGLPSATTIACADHIVGEQIAFAIGSTKFRPYYTDDIIGAQVGGAMKNVIAIACGISHGKGFGENARAAIITRGMAEIRRVCQTYGGKQETLLGLSGIGDLMLTCMSVKSRNFSFGYEIGQGRDVEEALEKRGETTEGIATSEALYRLAETRKLQLPLCGAVYSILHRKENVDEAINNLLMRQLQSE